MSGRLVTNRVLTEPLELDPVFAARNGNGAKPCDLVTDVTDSKGAGPTDPSPLSSLVTESVAAKAATLLDDVEAFLARFIAYPSEAERIAHTLWIAHTHRMAEWDSTPRIAFLSPEPGSGKSRALEVTELLVPRPIHAVNATPAGLFRKVSDEAGPPTILFDEVDTVFGPRAKDNEDVRGMLNAGHRRGATALRCKVVGKAVLTEELPAYCAVALAGLNDLPDTIRSRAVIVRMRKRTSTRGSSRFGGVSLKRKGTRYAIVSKHGRRPFLLATGRRCRLRLWTVMLMCGRRCLRSPILLGATGPIVLV